MSVFNKVAIFFLKLYKQGLSPLLPQACRFEPTCSVYARECFEHFGFFKAIGYTLWRLLRCNPFCKGGFDPISLR